MSGVVVVAEIGSSPAPAWDFAPWCRTAFMVGANAVKAQCFRAEFFPAAEQASKRVLEFPRDRIMEFVRAAHAHGLKAGASVFDTEAAALVAYHCDFVKLAYRERQNEDLTREAVYAAREHNLPLYRTIDHPDADNLIVDAVQLFTVPEYPAALGRSYARLLHRALWMRRHWPGLPWGWSSHTAGTGSDCVLAVRLGASVIEKHIALSPDNSEAGHSLLPAEFARLVKAIRAVERKDTPHAAA